jgi:hypothetical protein
VKFPGPTRQSETSTHVRVGGSFHRKPTSRPQAVVPVRWHVSAYADYDLAGANDLGLTTVFAERPHARPGEASHSVRDLRGLLILLS